MAKKYSITRLNLDNSAAGYGKAKRKSEQDERELQHRAAVQLAAAARARIVYAIYGSGSVFSGKR